MAGRTTVPGTARYDGLLAIVPIVMVVAAVHPARATQDEPVAVVADFGLLGTWSPDCTSPPSHDNPRVSFSDRQGVVMQTIAFDDLGPAFVADVTSARRLSDDTLVFSTVQSGRKVATMTVRLREGRIHVIRVVLADGRVTVEKEFDHQTGKPSLVGEQCAPMLVS